MIKCLTSILTIIVGITLSSVSFAQDKTPPTVPQQFNIQKMQLPPGLKISLPSPVFCSSTPTFMFEIVKQFGEKSIFLGVNPNTESVVFDVLYSKESGTFTIAQHFAVGNTCVWGAGKALNVEL